jgi:hypothetical protein
VALQYKRWFCDPKQCLCFGMRPHNRSLTLVREWAIQFHCVLYMHEISPITGQRCCSRAGSAVPHSFNTQLTEFLASHNTVAHALKSVATFQLHVHCNITIPLLRICLIACTFEAFTNCTTSHSYINYTFISQLHTVALPTIRETTLASHSDLHSTCDHTWQLYQPSQ